MNNLHTITKLFYAYFLFISLIWAGCTSTPEQQVSIIQKDTVERTPRNYQAISLNGDTLYAQSFPKDLENRLFQNLDKAKITYQESPNDIGSIIHLAKSYKQLQNYREALTIYNQGLQNYPTAAILYRQRGEALITLRRFNEAIIDLEKANELLDENTVALDQEGKSIHQESSRDQLMYETNFYLGAAYFLSENYGKAAESYEKCISYATNTDAVAVASDWLYMTYRRLGEDEIAEKTLDMIKDELGTPNDEGYFERILMYKGIIEPDSLLAQDINQNPSEPDLVILNQTYGAGNYLWMNGEEERGKKILQSVIDTKYWVGLNYIAAEADLAHINRDNQDEK